MAKPAVSLSGDSMGRAWPWLKVPADSEGAQNCIPGRHTESSLSRRD